MLAVVEHQQRRLGAEGIDDSIHLRGGRVDTAQIAVTRSEHRPDCTDHVASARHCGELDENDPRTTRIGSDLAADLDRQRCLAGPARTDDGDQTIGGQQIGERIDVRGPANEGRQRSREVRRRRRLTTSWQRLGEHRARRWTERRVVSKDLGLEIAELGPGFQTELVGKDRAHLLICTQGVGLPVLSIASDHQQRPPSFDQGLGDDERLELGGCSLDPAAGNRALEACGDRGIAHRHQTRCRGLADRQIGDVLERSASPQRQRVIELLDCLVMTSAGRRLAPGSDQVFEAMGIDHTRRRQQAVGRARRIDRHRCDRLSQLRHHRLEGIRRWGAVRPQHVVENIDRRRRRSMQGEGGQGAAQLRAANRDGHGVVVDNLQRPQHAQLHRVARLRAPPTQVSRTFP